MLNNRELASLILFGALLAFALTKPEVCSSTRAVIKTFFHPKILLPVVLYLGIVTGFVWLAALINLWDISLLSETLLWVVFSGFALLLSLNEAGKDPAFWSKRARQTISGAAFFEFFLNIKSFSLPVELVLVFVITVLAMMQVFVGYKAEFTNLRKPLNVILGMIVLGLVVATLVDLIANRNSTDYAALLQTLLLPVWLTLATLPYIYLLALGAGYELAFMRMEVLNDRKKPSLRSRLAVLIELRGRVTDLYSFGGVHARDAAQANSLAEARRKVKDFKDERNQKQAAAQAHEDRLKQYAGADGTDDSGQRLDQREFEETKKALRWLATCQMGWHRRRGGKYRKGLVEVLGDFASHGLPSEHGIVMHVRKGRQAWYAYRTTVSGWVFAIGAAKAPPDEWLFDGPQPPRGYPGSDSSWGESAFTTPANW